MKISRPELKRLKTLTHFENEARQKGYAALAGVDEAGRGPLAGPVVAAACMIPKDIWIAGVNDSKQLTPQKREEIFQILTAHDQVAYGVGAVSPEEIDRVNILQATILAMKLALQQLKIQPDYLLVDGMRIDYNGIPCEKIIQGDARSFLIASASIIAKVTRDNIMRTYHEIWPHYGFDQHKGYGTERHMEALEKYGPCAIHRKSFEPVNGSNKKALTTF